MNTISLDELDLNSLYSIFTPPLSKTVADNALWGNLHGASAALVIAQAAQLYSGILLTLVQDVQAADALRAELKFFLDETDLPILTLPDLEILPYDLFAPLPELISERLLTLYQLPDLKRGILVIPVMTMMQRLPPREYVDGHALVLHVGDRLDLITICKKLERAGYLSVSQVMGHGEYALRGGLLDLFPMGTQKPLRIELFDQEIEIIRIFDPETQRSQAKLSQIRILPAREFPFHDEAIAKFKHQYRSAFPGDLQQSLIYNEVSMGHLPGGIEAYLPLFFEKIVTIFNYLPKNIVRIEMAACRKQAQEFFTGVEQRYEQRRHDRERPVLPPTRLYLAPEELFNELNALPGVCVQTEPVTKQCAEYARICNFATADLPDLTLQARLSNPAQALQTFLAGYSQQQVLFLAESPGRREFLREQLARFNIYPNLSSSWNEFLIKKQRFTLTVAPLEHGFYLIKDNLILISEIQLAGERVRQERSQPERTRDFDAIVRNLTELTVGAPVVHEMHGVGRYLGLETLEINEIIGEFLILEYANNDRLYVPVSSLHLISRYTGASPEQAPLHRLGGDQWERLKRKAAQQAYDAAAELLDIQARRAAQRGFAFAKPSSDYFNFAAAFPFEETPDQADAIAAVLKDMVNSKPMDRVICGDVGFGKTEVAMRAAFLAVQSARQVAVLVPTTLLAQQHFANFSDRFADWPIHIDCLSRFRTAREQKQILQNLAAGTIDIIIGTHKLLQPELKFKHLGLVIVDEEHRFGVRHKESLKNIRSETDILTLTATPIPRTLNMGLAGLRDLSIIATPPSTRHPIKTFIYHWENGFIQEAVSRELKRGGQIYFLHNEVSTIQQQAQILTDLLPAARIQIAHGQMRERELERVMRDFYHQRFNLLICTTIIESGIDIPSANTIIINRADKLGLAQLHQLRGRVGRSHHRAYAYLITPPKNMMTKEAEQRLAAFAAMGNLGIGFTLATHDLEIRGAGELLGEQQSGQINEIGFSLYMDLLGQAVKTLKSGRMPKLDRPLDHGAEIDLGIPALLPHDYLPDIHARLVLYKRIASAPDQKALSDLMIEMIDRFGLLPVPAQNLFEITLLKIKAQPLGIKKIECGNTGGRIIFMESTSLDPQHLIRLVQTQPQSFRFESGHSLRLNGDFNNPTQRLNKIRIIIDQLSN